MAVRWQASLLGAQEPTFDAALDGARRRFLGAGAWVDLVPNWVTGVDGLFARVLDEAPWTSHERWMYQRMVTEPRLTAQPWEPAPAPMPAMAAALTAHYACALENISANLYRDGNDSVAWHADRVGRNREETVVAILSLGAPRRFLLRPKGGGASIRYTPNAGDLLVLGGTCQRTWEHCVPKTANAGPRISVMFRESY